MRSPSRSNCKWVKRRWRCFPTSFQRSPAPVRTRQGRFTQFYSLEISPKTWEKELAHARTFCFYEEIEFLIKNGLIKGGSLENAVVVRDDAVLTTEPLRYPNEFVRHKMLDILGDLSLVGRPMHGHLWPSNPATAANCELARRITRADAKAAMTQTFAPPPAPTRHGGHAEGHGQSESRWWMARTLDIMQVMRILPHRYPFLMVDRMTKIEGNKITGVKNVSINEPYFQGHFPDHPIMPGVLQLEAIAQVAGILTLQQAENARQDGLFHVGRKCEMAQAGASGRYLVIEVEMTKSRGKIGKAKGVC